MLLRVELVQGGVLEAYEPGQTVMVSGACPPFEGEVDVYLSVIPLFSPSRIFSITGMHTCKEGIAPYCAGIRISDCLYVPLYMHTLCELYGEYGLILTIVNAGENPLRAAPLGRAVHILALRP